MADVAIVNASPLILLAKAQRLDLLRLAAPRVLVPEAVAEEVAAHHVDAATHAVRSADWLELAPDVQVTAVVQVWDLGAGESAVLSLALQSPGAEVILDDLAGRRCAGSLGIAVRGTLGLVLVAKQRGIVAEARGVLTELRRAGMYLSDRVVDEALKLIGE